MAAEVDLASDSCIEYVLALSLLSRKPVRLAFAFDVKSAPEFIKLLAPESTWKVSGDSLKFIPGPLEGGKRKLDVGRIPDTLALVIVLSPFLRENLHLELSVITNYSSHSVDLFKITHCAIFKAFSLPSFDLSIRKRGFGPLGGGHVTFKASCVRKVCPIDIRGTEAIIKIRGFVITSRIGSNFAHRMISKIKDEMSDLANTKVFCIVNNRNDSGPSPGYECSILGESRHGVFFETVNNEGIPETMAEECCVGFLKSVDNGCMFDQKLLPAVILLMGLADGVSHVAVRELNEKSQRVLDLLKLFFKVSHKLEKHEDSQVLTIVGCGYRNQFMPM